MPEHSLAEFREAIRRDHDCNSFWVEAMHVTETRQGEVVWEGEVEVFLLWGHLTAEHAYAWPCKMVDGQTQLISVLHEGSVDSAEAAIRAALEADFKKPDAG